MWSHSRRPWSLPNSSSSSSKAQSPLGSYRLIHPWEFFPQELYPMILYPKILYPLVHFSQNTLISDISSYSLYPKANCRIKLQRMKSVIVKDPFWKTTHSGCKVTVYLLNDAPNVHNAKVFKTNSDTQFIFWKKRVRQGYKTFPKFTLRIKVTILVQNSLNLRVNPTSRSIFTISNSVQFEKKFKLNKGS